MSSPIFRKEALGRLGSPEQLDRLMPLTRTYGWVALAVVGVLVLVTLGWGVFGRIATRVEGHGTIVREGGMVVLAAPSPARVAQVHVHPGDFVAQGQLLITLDPSHQIVSPAAGKVLDLPAAQGERVEQGTPLVYLDPQGPPLQVVCFLPISDAARLQPGMDVRVTPIGLDVTTSHALHGRVATVGRFPASRQSMLQVLGSEEWVNEMTRFGPAVRVAIEPGNDWPANLGAPIPCQVSIVVQEQRPLAIAFGQGGRGAK